MVLILAPKWMLDTASKFDESIGVPELMRPELSMQAYAWYIQGRDKDLYEETDPVSILPVLELVLDQGSYKIYQVVGKSYIRYVEEDDKYTRYYYYKAVEKPVIPTEQLYEVILDLYELCTYYDVVFASIPLDMSYFKLLKDSKKLLDVEVEIMLAILCPWYTHILYSNVWRGALNNKQTHSKFVNPNPEATIRDYLDTFITRLPMYLAVRIPKMLLQLEHVHYPDYDIVPRKRLNPIPKMVETNYIENEIYAVKRTTLLERLHNELPEAVRKLPFRYDEYSGCVIAGGYLQLLSNDMTYKRRLHKQSDIDIFIYGERGKEILREIIDTLAKYDYDQYQVNNSALNITSSDGGNIIQVICTDVDHFYQIIYRFDNSACQIAYDGEDLWCTPDFTHHMTYGETMVFPPSIRGDHIIKAVERGYVPVYDKPFYIGTRSVIFTDIFTKNGDYYVDSKGYELPAMYKLEFKTVDRKTAYQTPFNPFKNNIYDDVEVTNYNGEIDTKETFKTYSKIQNDTLFIRYFTYADGTKVPKDNLKAMLLEWYRRLTSGTSTADLTDEVINISPKLFKSKHRSMTYYIQHPIYHSIGMESGPQINDKKLIILYNELLRACYANHARLVDPINGNFIICSSRKFRIYSRPSYMRATRKLDRIYRDHYNKGLNIFFKAFRSIISERVITYANITSIIR